MQLAILYVSTAAVFLILDAIMLQTVMKPLFKKHLGDQILESPRFVAATVFYLFYVVGLLYFVSLPALREGAPLQALWNGMFLGAIAYGTYEFTSYSVMRDWSLQQVAVDATWGTILTGVSAWAGVMITRAFV
ncbi:DUF2177 family protein [Profundibacterium mesophilum]|uniref:Membrane protein n=1 Tax=Profundibacterium mesophilum KAUST100406-0324 TaxID=1037889 RepID=A0A921P0K6_9RHOB|nr:DUF2177 family protein [Profundibacterium mesophilum]KAF0676988.1 putative membrane protein [Profundibacterium mesophilum KAUST100406-0324]